MKTLILILVLLGGNALACDITADIPKNDHSRKEFMLIGQQFLECIKEGDTLTVNFVKYNSEHRLLVDNRLHRLTSKITWLRVKPSRRDERRVNSIKKLNGVSYHDVKNGTSTIKCVYPTNDRKLATLGHEVLHSFLGSFHA